MKKNDITVMFLTTPLFSQIAEMNSELFQGLRVLMVGGDVLSPKYADKVRKSFGS